MALIVQKYGGTSVGTIERIQNVADRVGRFRDDGHDVVVVVSAMSGETNRLVQLANEVTSQPSQREMDVLVTTGEQVTIGLLAMALKVALVVGVVYLILNLLKKKDDEEMVEVDE